MFAASLTTEAPPQMIPFGKHPIALLIVIVIYILNHFIFRHEAQFTVVFKLHLSEDLPEALDIFFEPTQKLQT